MEKEIAEMDKAVKCLALELPETVHDDVARIWKNLREKIVAIKTKSVVLECPRLHG